MTMITPMSGKAAARPAHMAGAPAMLAAGEGEFAFLVRGLTGGEAEGAGPGVQAPTSGQPDAVPDSGDALIQDLALGAAADAAPPTVILVASASATPQNGSPPPQDGGIPAGTAEATAVAPTRADIAVAVPSAPPKQPELPSSSVPAARSERRTEVIMPAPAPSEPGTEMTVPPAAVAEKFVPATPAQGRSGPATAYPAKDGESPPAEEQAAAPLVAPPLSMATVVAAHAADARPSTTRARAGGPEGRSPASAARAHGQGVEVKTGTNPPAAAPDDPVQPAAPLIMAAASQQTSAASPGRAAVPGDTTADRGPAKGDRKDSMTIREPANSGTPSARPAVADIVQNLPPIIQSQIGVASEAMTVARPAGHVGQALAGEVIDMGVGGQWIDRMAREIASLAEGTGHSRFQLSPPHLGRIQIDVWQDAAGGSVQLLTETDEAARRLRDGQAGLQADARLSALSLHNIVIERSSSGFDSGRDQNGQNPSGQHQAGRDLAGQANGQAGAQGGAGSDQGKRAADRAVLNGGVAADASGESRAGRAEDGHVRYA